MKPKRPIEFNVKGTVSGHVRAVKPNTTAGSRSALSYVESLKEQPTPKNLK